MSNNLPSLLTELSEIAPQICYTIAERDGSVYGIGEYKFWVNRDKFYANNANIYVTGTPAYDWLTGALMRVIREQGMYWELRYSKPRNRYQAEIANHTVWNNDATEALLTALIQALKGEQWNNQL